MKNYFHFNLILAWFSSSFQNKRWDKVLTGNLVAGVSSVCVPEECVLSAGWVEQISRSHLCWSRPITVSGASEIWSMLPISQAQNKPLTVPMGSDHVLWRMKRDALHRVLTARMRASPPVEIIKVRISVIIIAYVVWNDCRFYANTVKKS